jgi:anaerobic selenocysteine-containing dehydrogenase
MNRRSVLQLLGLGGAGLALGLPEVKAQPALIASPRVVKPLGLVTPTWFMAEVAREFKAELGTYVTEYRSAVPVRDTKRLWVQMDAKAWAAIGDIDEVRERYIKPSALMLAEGVRQMKFRYLYELGEPRIGRCSRVWSEVDGISLRGYEVYKIAQDRHVVNIDLRGRA